MATSNPTVRGRADLDSPVAEDRIVESSVLGFILGEHPAHLTLPELVLAMNRDRDDFAVNDEVEQAIGELVGAGLLYLTAGFVLPTRAALYFDSLAVD